MNFYEAFAKKDLELTLRAFKFTPLFLLILTLIRLGFLKVAFSWEESI